MLTGGVPYYLTYVKKNRSAAQIIEELAFSKGGLLLEEQERALPFHGIKKLIVCFGQF